MINSYAHVAVEIGEAQVFGEERAVDPGKGGEGFVEVLLALFGRRVQDFKETREMLAEVGAIGGGTVDEVVLKGLRLKDSGVLGEEAEEDANEEALSLCPE